MATFTDVDDILLVSFLGAPKIATVDLSGTYDMHIAFERELGSPYSNVWDKIKLYQTPNATVNESFELKDANRVRLRVVIDNGGTCTALLTITSPPALVLVVDASEVAVTPAGTISANNVQGALEELDSEKSAIDHTHDIATADLDDDAVTNAKLANMAEARIKGRTAGAGTGDPVDLTAAQVIDILETADGTGSGLDADTLDGTEGAAFLLKTELASGTITPLSLIHI